MKLFSARNGVLALGLFAMFGCSICDDDSSTSGPPNPIPVGVRGFWPCIGPAGTTVRIYGNQMHTVAGVLFPGSNTVFTANRLLTSVDAVVPAAGATGNLEMFDSYLRRVGQSPEPFTVGVDTVVPEIEPNEDNPAATPMGPRTRGSGSLTSAADRDHFLRECFMTGARYSVTVQPPIVGVVYVNNVPVNLDAAGRGEFNATAASLVFGITGSVGNYTMTVGFVNP